MVWRLVAQMEKLCTKARLAEVLIAFQLKFCGLAIGYSNL